ncbi:pentapeptide repeat-containing protein, partial [Rhodococcus sp. BP-241]|nr:pentapeptide repeat-containing protein [Rhodococcus sp. BP-241]
MSLADDWENFGNLDERNVCVQLLRSLVTSPLLEPTSDNPAAAPFLAVRRQIVIDLHEQETREIRSQGWRHHGRSLLRSTKLAHIDFTGIDLSGANLSGADLTGANLSGADLTGANLTDATLTDATLTDADFSGADLTGADLTDAIYNEVYFDRNTVWSNGLLPWQELYGEKKGGWG